MNRYNDQASGELIEIPVVQRNVPPCGPIGLWMFQAKLHVSAGGADVFLLVCDVLGQEPSP